MFSIVPDFATTHRFATVGAGASRMWCCNANVEGGGEGWLNCACKNVSRAKARRSVKKPKYFTLGSGVSYAGDDESSSRTALCPRVLSPGAQHRACIPLMSRSLLQIRHCTGLLVKLAPSLSLTAAV